MCRKLIGSRVLSSFSYSILIITLVLNYSSNFIIIRCLLRHDYCIIILLQLFSSPLFSAWLLHYCILFSYLIFICFTWFDGLLKSISQSTQGRGKVAYIPPSPDLTYEYVVVSCCSIVWINLFAPRPSHQLPSISN